MLKGLKYIGRIIYARSRYSKYGDKGETLSYFQAILGVTFIVLMIIFMSFFIAAYISPTFYNWSLSFSSKMGKKTFAYSLTLIVFLLMLITIRKKNILNNILPKEEANKAVNYLLFFFLISLLTVTALFTLKYHH